MTPKRGGAEREVRPFEGVVMMNDFIDNVMPYLKGAEVKLALVIWRKTCGWGQYSERIGRSELHNRTKLDKDTIKSAIQPLCERVGIRTEQTRQGRVLNRTTYTWPVNERVAASLEKAREAMVGGKLPPRRSNSSTGEGSIPPEGGGTNPPTQYNTYQLAPGEFAPIGDPLFYDGPIQRLYLKLKDHGHREYEGVPAGAPLPFSYYDFEALVKKALEIGYCHHCAKPLKESNCSPDHMKALTVGGKSELSNIRIICWPCNKAKGSMSDVQFHAKMARTRFENVRK